MGVIKGDTRSLDYGPNGKTKSNMKPKVGGCEDA